MSGLFRLLCPVLEDGVLPHRYGADNRVALVEGVPRISFPLEWESPPEGTVSFALVFIDYDNVEDEGVPWIHWLLADLPATQRSLPENASRCLPGLIQGRNSWALPYGPYRGTSEDAVCHYGGPAPERPHRYECRLLALNKMLELEQGFCYNQLRQKARGHILGTACLEFLYSPGGGSEQAL